MRSRSRALVVSSALLLPILAVGCGSSETIALANVPPPKEPPPPPKNAPRLPSGVASPAHLPGQP